jgi:hypothetical protein
MQHAALPGRGTTGSTSDRGYLFERECGFFHFGNKLLQLVARKTAHCRGASKPFGSHRTTRGPTQPQLMFEESGLNIRLTDHALSLL